MIWHNFDGIILSLNWLTATAKGSVINQPVYFVFRALYVQQAESKYMYIDAPLFPWQMDPKIISVPCVSFLISQSSHESLRITNWRTVFISVQQYI